MSTKNKKKRPSRVIKPWKNPAENIIDGYYTGWESNHGSLNSRLLLPVEGNNEHFKHNPHNWYSVEGHIPHSDYVPYLDQTYSLPTEKHFRNTTHRVHVSKKDMVTLRKCYGIYRYVYNLCVEYYPSVLAEIPRTEYDYINAVVLETELRRLLIKKETNIVPSLLGDCEKLEQFWDCGYNLLQGAVAEFVTALYTQDKLTVKFAKRFAERNRIAAENGEEIWERKFTMKPRIKKSSSMESMTIQQKYLNRKGDKGIYSINIFPKKLNITFHFKGLRPVIENACHLKYTKDGKVFLDVPIRKEGFGKTGSLVAALDPGVRIFQTVFDNRGYSYMFGGNGDAEKLDIMLQKADRLRKGFKDIRTGGKVIKVSRRAPYKECFKTDSYIIRHKKEVDIRFDGVKGTKLVTKKSKLQNLRRAAASIELKVKNRIKYFHQKVANDLCNTYSKILIPKFRVKDMTQRTGDGNVRNIGSTTTRQLIRWGHYSFRELLKAKGAMTGTRVVTCTEEYTSKTCTNCLHVKHDLGDNKVYSCSKCKLVLHRDINAARNILMMNWNL